MHKKQQKNILKKNMKQQQVLVSLFHMFVKKTRQIILPFSLFSFMFLHPFWLPFMQSLTSTFSTFYVQIVSIVGDKNYIFLLCNGILVFVAKYSCQTLDTGRSSSSDEKSSLYYPSVSQKSTLVDDVVVCEYKHDFIHVDDQIVLKEQTQLQEIHEPEPEPEPEQEHEHDENHEEDNEEETTRMYENFYEEDQNEEHQRFRALFEEDQQVEEEEEEEYKEENNEEEEDNIGNMSTEDLNRKFDDFIRKMKEEIRFEAQQQLIVV